MNEGLHLETDNSAQTCHSVAMAMWQWKSALINNDFSDKWIYQLIILKQLLDMGKKENCGCSYEKNFFSASRHHYKCHYHSNIGNVAISGSVKEKQHQKKV